jgi:cytochrome P450
VTENVIEYDPYCYEIDADPHPVWKRMRDESPVWHNERFDFWAVSRFGDVYDASIDWKTFSSSRGTVLEVLDVPPELLPQFMIFMDPPRHDRLRRLVSRGFTARRIHDLDIRIRELACSYLDTFAPGDRFDFVQDFGAKLPMMVIGSLLGIPAEDQDQVRIWSDQGLHVDEGETVANNFKRLQEGQIRADGMTEYLEKFLAWKRSNPGDDLVDVFIASEIEDDDGSSRPLTDREILDFIGLLAGAGNETVARLLGSAGWVLPQHPDQLARLVAEPDAIPGAVEELLRYEAPSPVQARVTLRETTMRGVTLAAGSKVLLLTGSAGRDEREYGPTADRFDAFRPLGRHVSFGYGTHFCLGASLARNEARIALEELFERFPTWEVDVDHAERVHTSTVRGFLRLPVQV